MVNVESGQHMIMSMGLAKMRAHLGRSGGMSTQGASGTQPLAQGLISPQNLMLVVLRGKTDLCKQVHGYCRGEKLFHDIICGWVWCKRNLVQSALQHGYLTDWNALMIAAHVVDLWIANTPPARKQ